MMASLDVPDFGPMRTLSLTDADEPVLPPLPAPWA